MLDRTHAGFRCHLLQLLRTVKGDLPWGSHGTVAYEMDNLVGHFILVNTENTMA